MTQREKLKRLSKLERKHRLRRCCSLCTQSSVYKLGSESCAVSCSQFSLEREKKERERQCHHNPCTLPKHCLSSVHSLRSHSFSLVSQSLSLSLSFFLCLTRQTLTTDRQQPQHNEDDRQQQQLQPKLLADTVQCALVVEVRAFSGC